MSFHSAHFSTLWHPPRRKMSFWLLNHKFLQWRVSRSHFSLASALITCFHITVLLAKEPILPHEWSIDACDDIKLLGFILDIHLLSEWKENAICEKKNFDDLLIKKTVLSLWKEQSYVIFFNSICHVDVPVFLFLYILTGCCFFLQTHYAEFSNFCQDYICRLFWMVLKSACQAPIYFFNLCTWREKKKKHCQQQIY